MISMVSTAGKLRPKTAHRSTDSYESLEARARQSVERESQYAFCFRFIRFTSRDGRLIVKGCLPSFYLKQILIAHLQRIGIQHIDDQVDVINSHGLSSVPRRSVA